MFTFKRNKAYQPVKPEGYEGRGSEGRVAFSNAERSWEETFNLIDILANAVQQHDYRCKIREGWLIVDGDLYLRPEIVTVNPIHPTGARTVTSIAIAHEKVTPSGLFEYQHATGDDTNSAFASGFDNWIKLDLPVLIDAIRNTQQICTAMDFEFTVPVHRTRRALLGPVSHLATHHIEEKEEHPFCPCCLLTNSLEAFRQHLEDKESYGIRLLALSNEEGEVSADCRVNGIDWELGKEYLIKYGKTWPDRGFEMRKQYVLIYTRES